MKRFIRQLKKRWKEVLIEDAIKQLGLDGKEFVFEISIDRATSDTHKEELRKLFRSIYGRNPIELNGHHQLFRLFKGETIGEATELVKTSPAPTEDIEHES